MTVTQIIAEIAALPPPEKQEVIRFTRQLDTGLPVSGRELSELAEKLASTDDPEQADALNEQIVKGFYTNGLTTRTPP